jgi:hypothetical protein
MTSDISKLCADFLRTFVFDELRITLKATHARELIAAFFGYKSHAALLAERTYPLGRLGDAALLVPDVALMEARRKRLHGLSRGMPDMAGTAATVADFLQQQGHFTGNVCLDDPLDVYVIDILLPDADAQVIDALAGVLATTNATGYQPYYETAEASERDDGITFTVSGTCYGDQNDDRMFYGDTIDMTLEVELPRIAGHVAYGDPRIAAEGNVRDLAFPRVIRRV